VKCASIAWRAALAVLLALLTWEIWTLPKILSATLTPVSKQLTATIKQYGDLAKDIQDSVDDNYYDVKAAVESETVAAKGMADLVTDLHEQLTGPKGVMPAVTGLLNDSRSLVQGMQKDVDKLADSGNEALKPLASTLSHIDELTQTLNQQVKTNGDQAGKTVAELNKALGDMDKIIADPNIQKILASSADTSGHLAESAKSIDIAMRPFRQKAAMIKTVLLKAIGMIKVVYTL
jgi:ABC-type transporter Mla subunit MlaD